MFKVLKHSFCSKDYNIGDLSALQKRRMSKIDKILYTCIKDINIQNCPIIFASNYGEINRCIGLLSELSKDNLVSPTSFCKSVLNAPIGNICIQQQNNSEIFAISSEFPTETGFLSAFCKFDKYEKILILIYEEQIDEISYGSSFLVQKGDDISLSILDSSENNSLELSKIYDKFILRENFVNGKFGWKFN